MRELEQLPVRLRWFVLVIATVGTGVALLVLAVGWRGNVMREPSALLWLALLFAFAIISERFPLTLTHGTIVNVSAAVFVAMVVSLPLGLPGVMAFVATGIAQGLRYYARGDPDILPEALFNIGQTAAYVTAGALVFASLSDLSPVQSLEGVDLVVAVVAAALAMHLINTGLVAVAAGLQSGVSPYRVWRTTLFLDLPAHAVLSAIGAAVAIQSYDRPLLLMFMALPLLLVRQAVNQSVRLRADTHEAIAALVDVVELRDPYTAGHSRRVAATARKIARRLGLTEEEADLIEGAGRVHDVGKLAVDPRVLIKPGKLTEEEWAQMRLHPVHGANVISRFAAYAAGVPLIRHHHEAWDGSGYPDGLASEAIPLGARILTVADTFDALTSSRPYREGMSIEQAIAILQAGAGRQWDPEVVAALVTVLQEDPWSVPVSSRGSHPAPVTRPDDPDPSREASPVSVSTVSSPLSAPR